MNTRHRLTAAVTAILLLGFSAPLTAPTPKPHSPLRKTMPLAWKARTGNASFRTNVVLTHDRLIMGSNGTGYMDWNITDTLSGVHVIHRTTGKPLAHFANDPLGDMDVNGILLLDGRLYFGNDNDEFLCTTPDGRTLWNIRTSGDIEHQPVTLRAGNRNLVVFATESGEVRAVEPILGKTAWSFYLDDFQGWKPGDNRTWFKVTSHFQNSTSFFTKPLLADLDLDGTQDLVYLTYDGRIVALDGRNGRLQWTATSPDRRAHHLTPVGHGKDIAFLTFESRWNRVSEKNTQSIVRIDRQGRRKTLLQTPGKGAFGLNTLTLPSGDILLTTEDRLLTFNPDTRKRRWISRSLPYTTYDSAWDKTYTYSRNSPESLLGNRTFTFNGDSTCIAVLDQYDTRYADNGVIEIISLAKGRLLQRFALDATSEMPPLIEDIDRDGRLDLLVNGRNGITYCYRLER